VARISSATKSSLRVRDLLDHIGLEPVEGMARMALGDLVCPYCNGLGCEAVNRKQIDGVCLGNGKEYVSLPLRARMLMELASFVYPKARNLPAEDPDKDVLEGVLAKAEELALLLDGETPEKSE
jgi:hypothetical protein